MDPPKKTFKPVAVPPKLLATARLLRSNMTDAEQFMWHLLRRRQLGGFRFRRQHPFGPFVLDFYCAEARLALELDGGQHADMVLQDSERAAYVKRRGVSVVRVWNNEVFANTEGVLQMIYDAALERVGLDGNGNGASDSLPPP